MDRSGKAAVKVQILLRARGNAVQWFMGLCVCVFYCMILSVSMHDYSKHFVVKTCFAFCPLMLLKFWIKELCVCLILN